MDTNEIMLSKPKKRIFLALILCSTLLTAVVLYMVWKVTGPGLNSISAWLPAPMTVEAFMRAVFDYVSQGCADAALPLSPEEEAAVARLADGARMPEAMRWATAAAAIAVTRPGATSSLPGRSDVEVLLTGDHVPSYAHPGDAGADLDAT